MRMRLVWSGIILVFAVVAGVFVYKKFMMPAKGVLNTGSTVRATGPNGAPVTIIEFSDFQCPACRAAQPVLKNLLREYPGKIRLFFRHFPLQSHVWSPLAHHAAECAAQKRAFWQYHDLLYEHQQQWSSPQNPTETFLRYAREVGLDLDDFAACLTSKAPLRQISADVSEGNSLQVRSTPTFFINGERIVGGVGLQTKGTSLIRKTLGLEAPASETPSQAPPAP